MTAHLLAKSVKRKAKNILGFTLVELLIVISLIGAIATLVIATLNPIELINRARDTRFKVDGGQLISAIDRYFAATLEFPWVTASTFANEDAFGFVSASGSNVGICANSQCANGVLISNDELKTEFKSRDFIKDGLGASPANDQLIFIGKESGTSSSVYACYIPLANTTKQTSVQGGKVYHLAKDATGSSGGTRAATTDCNGANGDGKGVNWTSTGGGCYVCIPE